MAGQLQKQESVQQNSSTLWQVALDPFSQPVMISTTRLHPTWQSKNALFTRLLLYGQDAIQRSMTIGNPLLVFGINTPEIIDNKLVLMSAL